MTTPTTPNLAVTGTPVIAFKTGGLKDTVREFNPAENSGNGFTFEAYNKGDFINAVQVRVCVTVSS